MLASGLSKLLVCMHVIFYQPDEGAAWFIAKVMNLPVVKLQSPYTSQRY